MMHDLTPQQRDALHLKMCPMCNPRARTETKAPGSFLRNLDAMANGKTQPVPTRPPGAFSLKRRTP